MLRWLLLAILVGGAVAFYVLGLHEQLAFDNVRGRLDEIDTRVQQNIVLATLAYFLVYAILTALSVPAAWMLSLLAGALFGNVLGVGVALSAATCGATLAFLSSRFILRDWVQARFGTYFDAINRGIVRDGAYYLFSLRLVPLVPFFAINLCMGLTPIRTWTYAWVTFVGMLPGAALYVNAGTRLRELHEPGDILSPGFVLSFAALGLAPLAFRWLLARRSPRA